MSKCKTVALLLILSILTSISVLTSLTMANPYIYHPKLESSIPPPEGTKPPTISLLNPANNSYLSSNNLLFSFNASIEKSNNISLEISKLNYKASWISEKIDIDLFDLFRNNKYVWAFCFPINVNFTDAPKGPHWIDISATATGIAYNTHSEIRGINYIQYYVGYEITSHARVYFTIEDAPSILSVSVENQIFNTSCVPLNVITSQPTEQVLYSLDNSKNVTFIGNATLNGLANGWHTITIYASNKDGITSIPTDASFTVEASSFTLASLEIALVIMPIICAGVILTVLLAFKKVGQKRFCFKR